MKDNTKEELIDELEKLRKRIDELEKIKIQHEREEERLQQSLKRYRKALSATIQTVAGTVEGRDPYTAGHHRRASNLARAIATEMDLPKDQINGIRVSGSIHDIGKIVIPAEILNKLDQLSDYELDMIKNHPQVGYEILKSIDFAWPVAQIIFQHHERVDGSGYPSGLSGEDILLEARILSVADVVEAMSSNRIYRAAHGLEKALYEISQNKGILYDREVVDACRGIFVEKGFKLE